MLSKNATLLSIFIIGLLAVGIVSAADNSTNDVASVENTIDEMVSVQDANIGTDDSTLAYDFENEILSSSLNDEGSNDTQIYKMGSADVKTAKEYDDGILQADETSSVLYVNGSAETSGNGSMESPFKTLAEAIGVAQEGYTIKIASGEYTGSNNTGLTINKNNLVLMKYGDGEAIFDAQNSKRILTVNAATIDIAGLTFKNGYASKGAAIYFSQQLKDSVINANFINGYAWCNVNEEGGGAIYFNYALTNVTISGNFINNSARGYLRYAGGGAIYFRNALANVTISGNFINNSVKEENGFTGDGGEGGAIYSYDMFENVNINAKFINNKAFRAEGGAIYVQGGVKNSNINSTFNNNTAVLGGAAYFKNALNNVNLTGKFDNNTATGTGRYNGGGANYFNGKVENSNINAVFINNLAAVGGGANYFKESLKNVNLSGNFINNKVLSSSDFTGGGASYFESSVTDVNLSGNYRNNSAGFYGSVFFFSSPLTNVNISGDYRDNSAGNDGRTLQFSSEVTNVDIKGIFVNNPARYLFYIQRSISDNAVHDSIIMCGGTIVIYCQYGWVNLANNWFGNTADNYQEFLFSSFIYPQDWLFLNATSSPDKIAVDETSDIVFKFQSYNRDDGSISEYDSSKIDGIFDLSKTLGELNQNISRAGEGISYTAKQKGEGNITAKFESVSYTHHLINFWGTLVIIDNVTDGVYNTTASVVNYYPKFEAEVTTFTINKTDGDPVVCNKDIGELQYELFKLDVGDYTITLTAEKDGEIYSTTSDVFTVCRASSSVVISPIAQVTYGEESAIKFTVTNATSVSWEIIDCNSSLRIDNGTGLDSISKAYGAGKYTITVFNAPNERYNASSASMNFTVAKAHSVVEIGDIGHIYYGQDITVRFNVTNSTVVTYIVTKKDGSVVISNTTISEISEDLVLDVKDVGDYVVTIANAENENYLSDVKSREFSIVKAEVTVNVVAEQVTYGNNVIVNVAGGVAGVYSVTVNGITKNAFVTSQGEFASLDFGIFAANEKGYSIFANYTETDNYTGIANTTEIVIVNKAPSVITIDDISPVVYGNDVTVDFSVQNRTSVAYLVEKDGAVVILHNAMTDILVLPGLDAGDYVITISNAESENYSGDIKSLEFRVNKVDVAVYVAAGSVAYGNNVLVNVTGEVAGEYSVTVNGITKKANVVVPGVFVCVDFGILPANETGHIISANYTGTVNHAGIANTTEKIIVRKASSLVNITGIDTVTYGDNVTVRFEITNSTEVSYSVKTDDGRIVVDNVTITDAGADMVISGIGAGDYVVIISNAENVNYTSSSSEAQFRVLKADLTIEPEVVGLCVVDGVVNATFTLPEGINGIVTLSVDGVNVSLTNVSNVYTAALQGLTFGNHTVTVNLTGDSNFRDAAGSVTFKVKFNPKIVISDIDGVVGETVNANVTIDGGDASGYIIFEGVSYPVSEGRAVIPVKLVSATISVINVTYSGDDKYSMGSAKKAFIPQVIPNVSVNVTVLADTEPGVIVVFISSDEVNGEYVVSVGNETKLVNSTRGVAYAVFKNISAGTQNVTVKSPVSLNYRELVINKEFTINPMPPEPVTPKINITIPDVVTGETTSVTVELPSDATGNVTLSINGKDYKFDVIKGIATVKLPKLATGNYGYVITYSGDDSYLSFSKTGSLTVTNPAPKPVIKTTLTLKKVKVKRSAKKLVITATLKINGKAVKGKKIKFKFYKKSFTAKTNKKGVAKITVKKVVLKKLKRGKNVIYAAKYGKIIKKVTVKVK